MALMVDTHTQTYPHESDFKKPSAAASMSLVKNTDAKG